MKETDITLEAILRCYQPDEQELIKYSYHLAEEALKDKVRENKKPFIEHPLGVAYIVSNEIGLRYESVAAVFLHEAIRFNPDITSAAGRSRTRWGIPSSRTAWVISRPSLGSMQGSSVPVTML